MKRIKEKGNEALRHKQYNQALKLYNDAIEIGECFKTNNVDLELAILYSNCCAVHTITKKYTEAISAAKTAMSYDSTYGKVSTLSETINVRYVCVIELAKSLHGTHDVVRKKLE